MRREAGTAFVKRAGGNTVGRAFDIADASAALYWIQQVQKIGYRARITPESRAYDEVVEVSLPCRTTPVFRVHRGASSVVVTCPFGRMTFDTLGTALLAIVPLSDWQQTKMAHVSARATRQERQRSLLARASRLLRLCWGYVGLAPPG